MNTVRKNAVCGNCTLKLVNIAYRRAPWFRLVREPLKMGMRLLSRLHRVDVSLYDVRTPACYNCIRFYKLTLKEKSALFRFLHRGFNPVFDRILEKIVTEEEQQQAKQYADAASRGQVDEASVKDWMHGMKNGF